MQPGRREQTAGFLDIPLTLRNPVGLAALACIITSTPGTAWAGYNPRSGVLTMHVLDLVDEETWVRTIRHRYEKRLMDIFQ
jgi:multicomponent K+:H+ antiporter subunit E